MASKSAFPDIPRYEVLEHIASGGIADVWLAQRHEGTELVAVKTLLKKHAGKDHLRQRMLREAEIGTMLGHENLARVTDAGPLGDHGLYIAIEYLPGRDLEALSQELARKRLALPMPLVISIIGKALDGLHSAHQLQSAEGQSLGLVHRDLSPRNIQLCFDGRVKVIDFGLAHAAVGTLRTSLGAVLGTYRYMSPEQAIGEPLDARSDLYSLGTSLYELTTGTWLFNEPTQKDILAAIVEARLPPPHEVNPRVPRALSEVISRAMAHDRQDRFGTAEAMASALRGSIPTEWGDPEASTLGQMLEETFPHEAELARERLLLATHRRRVRVEGRGDITRDQTHRRAEVTEVVRSRSKRVSSGTEVVRKRDGAARSLGRARRGFGGLEGRIDPVDREALSAEYDLVRLVGHGGMGRIYLAQKLGSAELVVVKLIHPEMVEADREQVVGRFEREGLLLSRLDHPSIPRVRALEVAGRAVPYMAMEHVGGANLLELAEATRGRLRPEVWVPLALEILDALDHAHNLKDDRGVALGLVHRDISPNNLMATFDGVAKLIDFGVAHLEVEQLTAVERPLIGKVCYCSPEQALQQPLDRRSDIYSLGISLLELATGRAVIAPDLDLFEARVAVAHDEVPKASELVPELAPLDEFFRRAVNKGPEDRYGSAREMAAALRDAADGWLELASRDQIAAFVRTTVPGKLEEIEQLESWVHPEEAPVDVSRLIPRVPDRNGVGPQLTPSSSTTSMPRRSPAWALVAGGLAILVLGFGSGLVTRDLVSSAEPTETELVLPKVGATYPPAVPHAQPGAHSVGPDEDSRSDEPESRPPKRVSRPTPRRSPKPAAPEVPPPEEQQLAPEPQERPMVELCAVTPEGQREALAQLRSAASGLPEPKRAAYMDCLDGLGRLDSVRLWGGQCRRCILLSR